MEAVQLTDPHIVPAVWGVLRTPTGAGPYPGVVLLHGAVGWRHEYVQIAQTLADTGFAALAVDYYAVTGRATSREDQVEKWPLWQATARNAVAYLQGTARVSGRAIGLMGFSLGAHLALSVAASLPAVAAVVEYFGRGSADEESLRQEMQGFPPLLILHGEADTIIPVTHAYRLRDAVLAAGGEVELHVYPGAGHAFNGPWNPNYSEADASDASRRTIEFLQSRLGGIR